MSKLDEFFVGGEDLMDTTAKVIGTFFLAPIVFVMFLCVLPFALVATILRKFK